MDAYDERDDGGLARVCAALPPGRRRHAAALALWRLRAPLLMLGLDPEWGVHRTLLDAVFHTLLLPPGAAGAEPAVADLLGAPFFACPLEGEAEGAAAEVQAEVLAELAAWPHTAAPDPEHTERLIGLPRALAHSADLVVADALWDHPARHAHTRYLATGPDGVLGYHSARNHAVEAACHTLVTPLPPDTPLPATPDGREALALCETFSAELAATLSWCTTLGR
ncbi:hypothetical protein [Streptomyces sp. NPDC001436]